MNKYLKTAVMLGTVMLMSSGCVSYLVMKNSESIVAKRKAFAKGDQAAIRAIDMGNGAVGVGIDVGNWEALKEQPIQQLGAAIVDAALLYGGYRGVEEISESTRSDNKDVELNVNGNNNTTTVVNGNGNSNNGNPNYSTTSTTSGN